MLLLLGKVYARTARIMFAEGLYREGAKIMKLDASGKVQVRAGCYYASCCGLSQHIYKAPLQESRIPTQATSTLQVANSAH